MRTHTPGFRLSTYRPPGKVTVLARPDARGTQNSGIGTLGGYSTIWMAKALPADGLLVTLEADPKHALVAQQNIDRAGFSRLVHILIGDALESLPKVTTEYRGAFDLIFIDADKASTPEYFRRALALSRPGTVILVDNVVRKGEIANAESTDPNVQGMRRLAEMMAAEPRVAATAIQTVGIKGYDGHRSCLFINQSGFRPRRVRGMNSRSFPFYDQPAPNKYAAR